MNQSQCKSQNGRWLRLLVASRIRLRSQSSDNPDTQPPSPDTARLAGDGPVAARALANQVNDPRCRSSAPNISHAGNGDVGAVPQTGQVRAQLGSLARAVPICDCFCVPAAQSLDMAATALK